jgi:formylglycine-generating enzyme required for sulfatase activity
MSGSYPLWAAPFFAFKRKNSRDYMYKTLISITCISLAVLFFAVGPANSASDSTAAPVGPQTSTSPEQRVALVIGNSSYESTPLRNPVNDARAIGKALGDLGFEVIQRENIDQKEMKKEIQLFGQRLLKGGVGLFYFAGHGMQVNGRNYLIPVGSSIEHEKQVEYEAVDMGSVLTEMEYARNRLNIVILDACRDNPFARSFRSSSFGLASVNAPSGTLIAYATAPGSVANDGAGDNGLYTGELIKTILVPGLRIEDVFKQVRSAVRETTQGKQVPWESSSLEGDFYFRPQTADAAPAPPVQRAAVALQPQAPRSESAASRPPKIWKEPVTGMEFVWVPGGCYLMGSPMTEKKRDADEGPVHEVCVNGFWVGKTEVTNGHFRKFHVKHDSGNYEGHSLNGDDQPAVFVSWIDANNFAQWLSGQNGGQYTFRLPTEAEWEYAARAGTEHSRYWGDDSKRACDHENVADQTPQRLWGWDEVHECDDGYAATAPVGSFQPNGFGLHDMLGNVWEWCADIYRIDAYVKHDRNNPLYSDESCGSDRVIRGGYWHGVPGSVRSADRGSGLPDGVSDDLGFRLVREQ